MSGVSVASMRIPVRQSTRGETGNLSLSVRRHCWRRRGVCEHNRSILEYTYVRPQRPIVRRLSPRARAVPETPSLPIYMSLWTWTESGAKCPDVPSSPILCKAFFWSMSAPLSKISWDARVFCARYVASWCSADWTLIVNQFKRLIWVTRCHRSHDSFQGHHPHR